MSRDKNKELFETQAKKLIEMAEGFGELLDEMEMGGRPPKDSPEEVVELTREAEALLLRAAVYQVGAAILEKLEDIWEQV